MSIGFRPKGELGPAYHPDRDYAYLTPTLMCAAIDRLELATDEELNAWKATHQIATDELVAVAEALARAQRDFVNAADPVKSLQQALDRRDWHDIRYVVRQALLASIGEVFCAAWFTAVRDVSLLNEESPAAAGIADFATRVRQFAADTGHARIADNRATVLQLHNDVLQSRINTLGEQLKKLTEQLTAQKASVTVTPPPKAWWAKFLFWT